MGDHQNDQNDDVFSFFTTPNDTDSSAATPSTLFNRCSYSSSSSSGDESHPSGPSVDDSNKRIDYMIQFLDRRLSEDGNFDGIGAENDGDGSDSLPEFVGKCGGTGIFKVPIRSAVHPNRPPSLEVRPHPLRESQIERFLRTMTSIERQLWAGGEDGGLKVWDFDELYGSGRSLEAEDTAPYKQTLEMEIGSSVVCMIGDEGSRAVWSGHRDGRIRCWKLRADHGIEEALSWQAHRGPVLSIAISSYGDIWSGSEGGALKVWPWDALEKSVSSTIEQRHMAVLSVERSYIDPRNQVSVNGFANTLTSDVMFLVSDHTRARVWSASPLTFALWDARTRDLIKVFNIDGQLENRTDGSVFPDFGTEEEGKMKMTASKKEKAQSSLGFFQRSRNALMGAADAVRRAATKGGFCDDSRRTEAMVISVDGNIWTGSANGVLMRWDGNGNCLQEFSYQPSGILCMFTFCYRVWVGYSSGTVQVLDLEGKLLGGWVAHSGPVIKMAIGGGYLFTLANHGGIRGWNVTSPGPLDNVLRAELAGKEFLYSRIENLRILASTWNVGEGRASTDSLVSWLGCAATGVDIVVVGLQEVEMGAGVLAMSAAKETVGLEGSPLGQWWMDMIGKTLDEGSSFVRVGSRQLAGLLICVWVRHDLKPYVGDVDAAAVPCGFGRAIGNKGAVGVRLRMYDRVLCFVNCHFAAHLEAVTRRNADFDHVYRTMAFSRQSSSLNPGAAGASFGVSVPRGANAVVVNTVDPRPELSEADMVVFLGDFNLGFLTHLNYLRLSRNRLSGQIPHLVAGLSGLSFLDLSFNNLSGPTPSILAKDYRIVGNAFLCGSASQELCSDATPVRNASGLPEKDNSKHHSLVLSFAFGIVVAFILSLMFLFFWVLWHRSRLSRSYVQQDYEFEIGHLKRFSFREIQTATSNFSPKNILGQGGFGMVYKGYLPNGTVVAVKRLKDPNYTGEVQFQTEVEMIGLAVHRNLLRLFGFCMTPEERMLVYPYMPNGSVADCLRDSYGEKPSLDWNRRISIALGAARGLVYLHEQCNPKIIHRDVKAANILLDESFEAIVGDFGLAKLLDQRDSHVTTAVRGTIGHIAPEYLSTGQSSEKTDVFGFGILILELVTGHKMIDPGNGQIRKGMILSWVRTLKAEKRFAEMVDRDLKGQFDDLVLEEVVELALLCTQPRPNLRPRMSEVLKVLEGLVEQSGYEHTQSGYEARGPSVSRNYSNGHEENSFIIEAIELSGPR